MKIKHQLKKGFRVNCTSVKVRGVINPKHHRIKFYFAICHSDGDLYWVDDAKQWMLSDYIPCEVEYCTHFMKINSLKACISHIKRHKEIPKGTKFTVCSNFKGCNVYITK